MAFLPSDSIHTDLSGWQPEQPEPGINLMPPSVSALRQPSSKQIDVKATVDRRFEDLMNFQPPPSKKIMPLAESICRTLIKKHNKIFMLGEKQGIGKFKRRNDTVPMIRRRLEDLIQIIENQYEFLQRTWIHPGIHSIPGVNIFHRSFFFLKNLLTGEFRDGVITDTSERFLSFADEFNRRVEEAVNHHYPIITAPFAKNETELDYYNEHCVQDKGFKGLETEQRLRLELEFKKMFHQYLEKQDWHRFIKPAQAAVKNQCKAHRGIIQAIIDGDDEFII